MIQAVIISVGLFDPEAILSDITVVGIIVTEEVLITKPESKIKAYIIPTNEELVIARDTKNLIK